MKYIDSKNNIVFNNIKEAGVYHASGPIGLNGRYETNGDSITNINNISLLNAIDIDWNGALVESDVFLRTTGDLLRWIKNKQSSGGTVDISINDEGYWCINGVSLGVKAKGENGLTPYIGANGNWWIGRDDTGIPASSTATLEADIKYTSNYVDGSNNTYRLGVLKVGNKEFPIIGKESTGGNSSTTTNIIQTLSDNISYTPQVTNATSGSYAIGTFNIGNKAPITLYGINTTSDSGTTLNITNIVNLQLANSISYIPTVGYSTEGSYEIGKLKIGNNSPVSIYGKDIAGNSNTGGSLNQPLASINNLNRNPSSNNSLLLYNGGNWGYKTLNEVAESVNLYFTEHNYYNTQGGGGDNVSVSDLLITGTKIATLNINGTPYNIMAPNNSGGGGGGGNDDYDHSALESAVSNLLNALGELSSTVQNMRNWTSDEINALINLGLSDWDWGNTITPDEIFNLAGWDEKLQLYFSTIAFKDSENNELTISLIILQLNSILSMVENIKIVDDLGNEITFELLVATVKTLVETDIEGYKSAVNVLEAAFNRFTTDENGEFQLLKSNFSAFKSTANEKFAELFTTVDSKVDKSYVDEKTGLLAGEIDEATAGLYTKTEIDDKIIAATAQLVSESTMSNYVNGELTPIRNSLAGLYTNTQIDDKITSAKADVVTEAKAYTDDLQETIAHSGFVTSSLVYTKQQADGKIAEARSAILDSIDDEYAKIETVVTKTSNGDGTYSLESGISISADKINFNSDSTALTIKAFKLWNGNGVDPDASQEAYMTLSSTGLFHFAARDYIFNSNSDEGDFHVNCEQIYLGNEHCDKVRLGDLDADTTIQLYGDIDARNGDVSVAGDLSSSGNIIGEEVRGRTLRIGNNDPSSGSTIGLVERDSNGLIHFYDGVLIDGTTKVSRGYVLFSEVSSGGSASMEISGLSGYGINCDSNLGITGTLILAFYSNGQITANKTISTSSDIRQKDIQSYVDVSVESISNIPIFYYTWKEIENSREYLGTSALDVLEIFPLAVTTTLDDTLALDYSPVALASAVITAREVVTLKEKVLTLEEENQSLKERLANIEATLERINTALG